MIRAVYDPVLKRYRATCPLCGYFALRAKREASEHVLSQHINYVHDGKVVDDLVKDHA